MFSTKFGLMQDDQATFKSIQRDDIKKEMMTT